MNKITNIRDVGRRYTVQKDVVVPKARWHKYPFATMEVGDSFVLAGSDDIEVSRVRASSCYYGIRHPPRKFSVRLADPETKVYRCWRVK